MTEGREEPVRVDVLLDRLCLTRSRSEAKAACDAGAVSVNGKQSRASQEVRVGDSVAIRFPGSTVEIRVEALPPKSTSKKAAREMYTVLQQERG